VRNDWDIPRLFSWYRYCGDRPPLRQMVQAYLGIKPKKTVVTMPVSQEETGAKLLNDLMKIQGAVMMPDGIQKR
jgi:hypothetical protein